MEIRINMNAEQQIKAITNWLKEQIIKWTDRINKYEQKGDKEDEKSISMLGSWVYAYQQTLIQLVENGVVIETDLVLRQEAERLTQLLTLDFTNHELRRALSWQKHAANAKDYVGLIHAENQLRKWVNKARLEIANIK
jgi:hypothetical protein